MLSRNLTDISRSLVTLSRPGYRMTETGEIPEEWDILPLTKVAKYINGMAFKPSDWKKQGIPIVRIENLNDSSAPFNYFDEEVDNKFLLNDGDILLSWSASLGVYIWNRGKAVLNQHIFKVVPNETVNKYYLFWALHNSVETLSKVTHGSTMKHFQKGELERTKIALPSLSEQQKIAEILSNADESIQKVNEEITMTEKLKKGLMQTLLTKGIGHTKFKITEIGEIPTEWAIKSISECSVPVSSIDPSIFSHSYFKYIDVSGISSEKLAIVYTKEIQGIAAPSRARKEVKEEDVIFATVRPYLKRVAIVPKNLDGQVCSTAFCVVRAKRNEIMPCFLYYYMTFDKFVNKISEFQTGSAYPAVSDSQVMSQRVPIPKVYEQQKIADILSTVDNKLELFRKKKTHLEKLKKGLMGDLLTGKIRVKLNTSKGEN